MFVIFEFIFLRWEKLQPRVFAMVVTSLNIVETSDNFSIKVTETELNKIFPD